MERACEMNRVESAEICGSQSCCIVENRISELDEPTRIDKLARPSLGIRIAPRLDSDGARHLDAGERARDNGRLVCEFLRQCDRFGLIDDEFHESRAVEVEDAIAHSPRSSAMICSDVRPLCDSNRRGGIRSGRAGVKRPALSSRSRRSVGIGVIRATGRPSCVTSTVAPFRTRRMTAVR